MITQKKLKQFLKYNKNTGIFTRTCDTGRHNRYKKGSVSGYLDKSNGYIKVCVDGGRYYAHQLAFLYMRGYIPEEIDHIDRNKTNIIFSNLRDVTRIENCRNQKLRSNNISGTTGVCFSEKYKKWRAYIHVNGSHKCLGYFVKKEDAIKARKKANKKYLFHENHGKTLRNSDESRVHEE